MQDNQVSRKRSAPSTGHVEPLEKQIEYVLEEARMVLPGVQALFGFQLIAVFNQRFVEAIGPVARLIHLAALILVGMAVALIMAPAAYHRQVERDRISQFFVKYASRMITAAMAPLFVAICAEVGVVTDAVVGATAGLVVSLVLGIAYGFLWYVFPSVRRSRQAR